MKKYSPFLIITCVALLQLTILDKIKLFNIKPDVFLAIMVLVSPSFDLKWALALAVFCGFLKDIFAATNFGLNASLFAFWSYAIIKLSHKIAIENDILRLAVVFCASLVNSLLLRFALIFFGSYQASAGILLRVAFFESAYTCLASWPIIFILKRSAIINYES